MSPQAVPERYSREFTVELMRRLDTLERVAYVRGRDLVIGVPDALKAQGSRAQRIILVSPNGTQYQVLVDDAGALSTAAV